MRPWLPLFWQGREDDTLGDLIPPVFRGPDNPVRRKKHHERECRKKTTGEATGDGSGQSKTTGNASEKTSTAEMSGRRSASASSPLLSDATLWNIAFLLPRDGVCRTTDKPALESAYLSYATSRYQNRDLPLTQAPPLQISQITKPC